MSKQLAGSRPPAPKSLSDFPTLGGVVLGAAGQVGALPSDLERTLPMEPLVLAELCAATQISARRRVLPANMEYSIHVELPPGACRALVAPRLAAPRPMPLPPRSARAEKIGLFLGSCAGLALGALLAWRIDLAGTYRQHAQPPPAETPVSTPPLPAPAPAEPLALPAPTLPPAPPVLAAPPVPVVTRPSAEPSVSIPAAPLVVPAVLFPAKPVPVSTRPAAPPVRKPDPLAPADAPRRAAPAVRDDELLALLPPDEPLATTAIAWLAPTRPAPTRTTVLPPPRPPVAPRSAPQRISGEDPQLPQPVRQMYGREPVVGTYRICVQPSGVVSTVTSLSPIPHDDELKRTLQSWRYTPLATPVCVDQELRFVLDDTSR